jgi:hypothetical protein
MMDDKNASARKHLFDKPEFEDIQDYGAYLEVCWLFYQNQEPKAKTKEGAY